MRVGLMMVVRNEAHRMAECLEHHLQYFDDAVICDQSSDDGTWDLLANCDFKLKNDQEFVLWQDKNHGHCAPSRQKTLDMLRADWVVMVDADEKFSTEFLTNVHNIATKGEHHNIDCYTLLRQNSFDVQVYDDTVAAEPKWLHVTHPVIEKQFRFFAKRNAIFDDKLHGRVHFNHGKPENIGHLKYIIDHRKTLGEMQQDLARFKVIKAQQK